jgi:hypothetical protein
MHKKRLSSVMVITADSDVSRDPQQGLPLIWVRFPARPKIVMIFERMEHVEQQELNISFFHRVLFCRLVGDQMKGS